MERARCLVAHQRLGPDRPCCRWGAGRKAPTPYPSPTGGRRLLPVPHGAIARPSPTCGGRAGVGGTTPPTRYRGRRPSRDRARRGPVMAVSNRDRVGKALDLLQAGLAPYVEREMQARHGADWRGKVSATFPSGRTPSTLDVQALLSIMRECWPDVFSRKLGNEERTLVHELREVRNRWAHQQAFSFDDAYRALDSVARLLTAVAAEEAAIVEREKHELLRLRYEEQRQQQLRRAAAVATEGQPLAGLPPWREVVTPHPDVASGRYQEAEFAADLAQVVRGEGAAEYRDPVEFFRRTYLTEGLRLLLVDAARRLAGQGDAPP